MATYLKGAFKTNANYLIKSAQEFPDEDVAGGKATMQDVAMEQVLDESPCHAARGEES